jgi:hypothetical protein
VAANVRKGNVTRAVVVAIVLEMIGNGTGIAISTATSASVSPIMVALTVAGASVVTGLAVALLPRTVEDERAQPPSGSSSQPPPGQPSWGQPPSGTGPAGPYAPGRPGPSRRRGGVSAVTAVVVILLLCGVGGVAATYGVQQGFRYVHELIDPAAGEGVDRLEKPVSRTQGPLALTVTRVEVTAKVTKVELVGKNTGDRAISLPVTGNGQFILAGGRALPGRAPQDFFEVPSGQTVRKVIVFDGVPGPAATQATLSFAHVFGTFDISSFSLPGIRLSPG